MSRHWSAEALCKDMDGEIFFPFPNDHAASVRYVICAHCPVTEDCLESGLSSPGRPFGVWGGRTEAEVQRMWEERRRQLRRAQRVKRLQAEDKAFELAAGSRV